ncbi:hypothetical protein EBI_26969 [Enterocytozoon bieneusi H348]|nr:hypothetical protein EBI_26969 [Enterocytozoon bieneusi H348]|eukprot:XP_002652563.1 hypothetical protein EBI_26969 [Enterocytozoon bieneusi H348]
MPRCTLPGNPIDKNKTCTSSGALRFRFMWQKIASWGR